MQSPTPEAMQDKSFIKGLILVFSLIGCSSLIAAENPSSNLYYGITPASDLELEFNNIGFYDPSDQSIYSCLRIFENGSQSSLDGIERYGVSFEIVASPQVVIRVTGARPFNESNGLTDDNELPDCSGIFETTTGVLTDTLQAEDRTYTVEFDLLNAVALELKLTRATFIGGRGPEVPENLALRTEFGSASTLRVETDGIFAIWWDPKFDHEDDFGQMFSWLNEIRADVLLNLGMQDPPNPGAGYFYNVYIHHGNQGLLPSTWGNGQGTDINAMPYLTLPAGFHLSYPNVLHEGFHVFQYSASAPGFSYAGDSQWYTESAAQWYAAKNNEGADDAFLEAAAIIANPQLTLWHSYGNEAPGDPIDWFYLVHQYGMHSYLYYLSDIVGVNAGFITDGFYSQTLLNPQQYLYENIGGTEFRKHFANWAAHNTGGLDYLTPGQIEIAVREAENYGDPATNNPTVVELTDDEANGEFLPPLWLAPRGWGYNVIKINNTADTNYAFKVNGSQYGSDCADAHFEARLVVVGAGGPRYIEVAMDNALTGSASIAVEAGDTEIYLVIAAVPEHFTGNQFYDYSIAISRGDELGAELSLTTNAQLYTNPGCGAATPVAEILGTYIREPYENGYHQGVITNDGTLRWTNDAGVSWGLSETGLGTAVFDTIDGVYASQFQFSFSVPSERDEPREVFGFYFNYEFYTKQ